MARAEGAGVNGASVQFDTDSWPPSFRHIGGSRYPDDLRIPAGSMPEWPSEIMITLFCGAAFRDDNANCLRK